MTAAGGTSGILTLVAPQPCTIFTSFQQPTPPRVGFPLISPAEITSRGILALPHTKRLPAVQPSEAKPYEQAVYRSPVVLPSRLPQRSPWVEPDLHDGDIDRPERL